MPKYVIERNMPGAGALTPDDLASIAEKSCRALEEILSQLVGCAEDGGSL